MSTGIGGSDRDEGAARTAPPSRVAGFPGADQLEISRLTQQLDAGHPRLRFAEPLEAMFRRDYELAAAAPRSVLVLLAILMVGITPLYDARLLHAPEAFLGPSHRIQWCLMLPPLLLALAVQRWKPASHDALKQSLVIGAAVAVWAGLTAQRAMAGYYDFYFPHDFGVVAIAATFVMGRVLFSRLLPWALVMLAGSLLVEILRTPAHGQGEGIGGYDVMSLTMMWVIGAAAAWLIEHVSRAAWLREAIFRRMAIHDTLTGLSNRRHFQTAMELLIRQALRERQPITVMLIDIDHFKAYNDHSGHVAGDDCLRRIGGWLLTASRRPQDLRARLGGEEFVAVWIGVDTADITRLADGLRDGIARLDIAHPLSPTAPRVTASAGLVHGMPGERTTPDSLLRSADTLLYAAKDAGRDRLMASFGSLDGSTGDRTVVPFSMPVSNASAPR